MKRFRLTKECEQILFDLGYVKDDIPQIKQAVSKTTYTFNGKKISCTHAADSLGLKQFLASLGRSAFHYSTIGKNGKYYIEFNSSKLYAISYNE